MAQTKRTEGVQTEEGKPVEDKQVSTTTEQADVDGVRILDVTQKYRSKRDPDKAVSGDELWAGYSRGRRFDEVQSENQKLQAHDQAMIQKLSETEERAAQLEADLRMAKAMQNLGVGGLQQKAVAEDDWATPGEQDGTLQNITPQDIAGRFDALGNEMKSQLLTPEQQERLLKDEVARLYAIEQAKKDAEEGRTRAAANIDRAKMARLKTTMPDISDEALRALVGKQKEFIGHALAAVDLSLQGDQQGSIETYMDGDEKLDAMLAQQLKLLQQQTEITAERERQAELESFSSGSLPSSEAEERPDPKYDWHDGEKNRASLRDKAKSMITRQKTLRGA